MDDLLLTFLRLRKRLVVWDHKSHCVVLWTVLRSLSCQWLLFLLQLPQHHLMILFFKPNKFGIFISSICKKLLFNLICRSIHMTLSVVRYRSLSWDRLLLSYRRRLILLISIISIRKCIDSVQQIWIWIYYQYITGLLHRSLFGLLLCNQRVLWYCCRWHPVISTVTLKAKMLVTCKWLVGMIQ